MSLLPWTTLHSDSEQQGLYNTVQVLGESRCVRWDSNEQKYAYTICHIQIFSDLLHSLKDLVKKADGSIPVSALFQYYSKIRSAQYTVYVLYITVLSA